MKYYFQQFKLALRKGDWVLLLLCAVTTAFGCLIVASATNYLDSFRYVGMQIVGALIGILLYTLISTVDVDFFLERRIWLMVFNIFFLALLIPFGVNIGGNKSWVQLPFLPFNIQVAEICKITYILIMASVMNAHKERISAPKSSDLGVSLIFVFIFVAMAYTGGVNLLWFAAGIGGIALAFPVLWPLLSDHQRLRIEVLFNPQLDANGTGVLWQTSLSLRTLTGGGLLGQCLFDGHRTQNAAFTGQHTDWILSVIGEELGYVGCLLVLLLLSAIIGRCIWVGLRSQEYSRRLICFGAAAALIFQTLINIGMCTGVGPVIGLTLPFISYGATSIVSLYAMLGLVSGVYARPAAVSHERYIRPPIN